MMTFEIGVNQGCFIFKIFEIPTQNTHIFRDKQHFQINKNNHLLIVIKAWIFPAAIWNFVRIQLTKLNTEEVHTVLKVQIK